MSATKNSTTPAGGDEENSKLVLSIRVTEYSGVIGLFALVSNAALCAVLLRNRQMLQRAYNFIILSIAIVDTLTGMTMVVATVLGLLGVLGSQPVQGNVNGLLQVVQRSWFDFFFGELSIFLVMVLTIERWFAVVKPIQYRYRFRTYRVYVYIFTILITTLAININGVLPRFDCQSKQTKIFVTIDFVFTLIFPLFVTWAAYIHLWRHCIKAPTIQQSNSTELKQKLARMCAITAMFLTVCWIPTKINYFVTTLNIARNVPQITKSFYTLALSNSIVNPWIYYFTNKEYKKEFKRLFNEIAFSIQDMVKCFRSDSLTVRNAESQKATSSAIPVTVVPLTNFSLENTSFNFQK